MKAVVFIGGIILIVAGGIYATESPMAGLGVLLIIASFFMSDE